MFNGIMVEGNWITNPCLIKDDFLQFYKRKFQAQDSQVMFSNLPHSHSLNCMDRETLERQVTFEEIKEAVWDCGSSKAPGPDGYSFAFCEEVLEHYSELSNMILLTYSFSLVLCHVLDLVINGALGLKLVSILRELLFLLMVALQGLHNAFEEAVGNGLITGVNIKNSTINVSHLFYADDVIITTDWNAKDMDYTSWLNICRLKAFNLALLKKWRWRLLSSPNALWVQVIKAYHGQEGGFDTNDCSFKGIGLTIVWNLYFLTLEKARLLFLQGTIGSIILIKTKIVLSLTVLIEAMSWNWSRTNLGVRNLAYLCDMLNEIGQLNIDVNEDTCTWSLGRNGTFTVKDARYRIDQILLSHSAHNYYWDKSIPPERSMCLWRLSLDRHTLIRLNLSSAWYGYSGLLFVFFLAMPMLNLLIMFSSNATLLPICGSSFLDGVIFLFFKLLLGILSMIGSSLGMLLKRKNTGSMLLLLRFFGGFGDTEIADHMKLSWNGWLMYPLSINANGNVRAIALWFFFPEVFGVQVSLGWRPGRVLVSSKSIPECNRGSPPGWGVFFLLPK
ncbi:hypothetical protein Tco_1449874 [Tanacetum coccineum]